MLLTLPRRFRTSNLNQLSNHDLARGLVFAVFPGGPNDIELVSRRKGTLIGSGSTWQGGTDIGKALTSTTATTSGACWTADEAGLRTVTRDYTIALYLREGAIAANRIHFAIPVDNATSTNFVIYAGATASSSQAITGYWNGSVMTTGSRAGYWIANGPPRLWVFSKRDNNVFFYRDGTLIGNSGIGSAGATLTWPATIEPICLLTQSSTVPGNSPLAANLSFAGLWNRALSGGEIVVLGRNPAILLSHPPIILAPAAIGGGAPQLLQSAIAGTSTQSGSLSLQKNLSSTVAGSSTATGVLSLAKNLAANLAGSSTQAGSLSTPKNIASGISGTSMLVGALTISSGLSGAIASTSTATGILSTPKNLAGSVAGISAQSGTLATPKNLAAAIAGVSTQAGALLLQKNLSSDIAGTSTFVGSLSVGNGLAGTISGTSNTTGTLSTPKNLAGNIAATSIQLGALGVQKNLAGAIAAVSTQVGALTSQKNFAGSISGALTVAGSLTIPGGGLQTALAAISTAAALLRVEKLLQVAIASTSLARAELTIGVRNTPPERVIQVQARDRLVQVQGSDRTIKVNIK